MTECTLGRGPFGYQYMPRLTGYIWRPPGGEFFLPPWQGQRLLDDAIERDLLARMRRELTPVHEPREWTAQDELRFMS